MDTAPPPAPTSYSQFSLRSVVKLFGLELNEAPVLPAPPAPIPPETWLTDTLRHLAPLARGSEKARSEAIIAPILAAVRELLPQPAAVHSGLRFDVAPEKGLSGYCDFIIGLSKSLPIIQAPLLALVEVKEESIDGGLGQCAAEMVAAEIFNRQEGRPLPAIFGCVTNADTWQFLRLENNILTLAPLRLPISDLPQILGTFKAIADEATAPSAK